MIVKQEQVVLILLIFDIVDGEAAHQQCVLEGD